MSVTDFGDGKKVVFFKAPFQLLFKGKAGQKKSALKISARKSAEQNTSSCPACGSLRNLFSHALCHCCRACKSQGSLFLSQGREVEGCSEAS